MTEPITIVITGAGSGIGRATGLHFANIGAKLILVDCNAEKGHLVLEEVRKVGAEAVFVKADVGNSDDVRRMIEVAVASFGSIDTLFNNAGIEGEVAPIDQCSVEFFDEIMRINVRSVFLGMKYVIPVMRAQGRGSIINTSSIRGIGGRRELAGYTASKHAVIGLTRSAALDVAAEGIRINAICPGPIESDMVLNSALLRGPDPREEVIAKIVQAIPARRLGKLEEVAALVDFLASDKACFLTGACIPIDGGMTSE
jgi:NAD(P)-dependent dehydrogenase (short-subunit alcohol dehydrogenase family)